MQSYPNSYPMTTKAAQYPDNETQRYFDAENQNEELQTIASGQEFKRDVVETSIRVGIRHAGYIAWLTKLEGGNAWIVTGYEENPDGATAGRATDAPTMPM